MNEYIISIKYLCFDLFYLKLPFFSSMKFSISKLERVSKNLHFHLHKLANIILENFVFIYISQGWVNISKKYI